MKYDLIIVSQSKDQSLITMTQNAINTCLSDNADVNVILIETHQPTHYDYVNEYINYTGEFCYNRALNMGIEKAKGDVFILANNDLLFQPGWSTIGYSMQLNNYLSASALSNDIHQKCFKRGDYSYEGYNIGMQLTGWCLFVARECIEKIGKLSETHQFWFSDNDYADQLRAQNIVHALICNVTVMHLGSRTLAKATYKQRYQFTHAERKKLYKPTRTHI